MEAKTKDNMAILECYRELYKAASPPADFDKMIEDAKEKNNRNSRGQLVIDMANHALEQSKFDEIVNRVADKHYKGKGKWKKQMFKNTIYMGASPRFSHDDEVLLDWYIRGWHDRMRSMTSDMPDSKQLQNAYQLGAKDANPQIGTEIQASDRLHDEQLLEELRKPWY